VNKLNGFLIFLAVTLAGIAPAFASAPPEFLDMGEADGYHYSAKVVAKTGPEDNRIFTWEISREKDGKTETIYRIDLSNDRYSGNEYLKYIGVFPDNQYFYLANSFFLNVYPLNNPQELVIARDLEDLEGNMIYQICIIDGKLYFLTCFCADDSGTLYRVDLEKRAVEEIMTAEDYLPQKTIIPEEESVLYSDWGPDNSDTFKVLFGEDCDMLQAMDLFGLSFCGSYYIDWVLDLNTGDKERFLTAQASSTLLEEGKPTDYLSADKAIDGDISTAWVEGMEGPGISESLTINLCRELELSGIALIPGYAQSQEVFWGNNRLKKARLEFSDGSSFEQSFTDQICMQDISLPDSFVGLKTRYVKITILEVYPGSRWDDTCISEVALGIERR